MSNYLYRGWKGCALAEPGGPWCPPYHLIRGPENLSFFHTDHMLGTIDFTGSETWVGSKLKFLLTTQSKDGNPANWNKRVRENWKIGCQYPYKNKS